MASADSVTKLRTLLDELTVDAVDRPGGERPYHQAVLDYMDLRFQQRTVGGTDEAMRVISPEEWSLANQARLAAKDREQELDDLRMHLQDLQAREDALKARVDQLEDALEEARSRREELVTFDLVGVREEEAPEEELVEFQLQETTARPKPTPGKPARQAAVAWQETDSPAVGWAEETEDAWQTTDEPVSAEEEWEPAEDAGATETWEPTSEPSEDEPAWEAEEKPRVRAPPAEPEAVQVEEEIRKIEDEIRKIEEELALIAAQERELEEQGVEAPKEAKAVRPAPRGGKGQAYREGDYTLFVKDVKNPDGSKRAFYFFARDEERDDAEPTSMPPDYEVGKNARTGMPYLRRSSSES